MILLTVLNAFESRRDFLEKKVGGVTDPDEIERKKKLALKFWNGIDSNDWWMILLMLGIVVIVSYLYFIPFNERTGRHYKPSWWLGSYAIAIVTTLVLTVFTCALVANYSYDATFIWKVAGVNTLLAFVAYFFVSWAYWKWSNTNAYRIIY